MPRLLVGGGKRVTANTMARAARIAKPSLSTDAKEKLMACLNWPIGLSKRDPDYQAAPDYYDAAWEWYRGLSPKQRETVSTIIAARSIPDRRKVAKIWAADLPPAPKCPTVIYETVA